MECDKKNERLNRAKEKLKKKLEEAKKLLAQENLKSDKAIAVSELNLAVYRLLGKEVKSYVPSPKFQESKENGGYTFALTAGADDGDYSDDYSEIKSKASP
jgi:hypothetical protein